MSYGLLSLLSQMIGSIENLALVTLDGELRDMVLTETIRPRDTKGKPVEDAKALDIGELTFDEAIDIADWVSEHARS